MFVSKSATVMCLKKTGFPKGHKMTVDKGIWTQMYQICSDMSMFIHLQGLISQTAFVVGLGSTIFHVKKMESINNARHKSCFHKHMESDWQIPSQSHLFYEHHYFVTRSVRSVR